MYRKGIIILLLTFVLTGCWDERLYKNQSVISLVGVEGEIGDYKGYYAYPKSTGSQTEITIIEGSGISPRDVRNNAELKVEQTLDLSELSTILISDKTAKSTLYDILDIYFRDPKNPVSIKVALTEGDVKPFISMTQNTADIAGTYFQRFFESAELNTIFPKQDLQKVGSSFFDNAIDVAIPYVKYNEKDNILIASGVALISDQTFTGKVLTPKQSQTMLMLMDEVSQHAGITCMWKKRVKNFRYRLKSLN